MKQRTSVSPIAKVGDLSPFICATKIIYRAQVRLNYTQESSLEQKRAIPEPAARDLMRNVYVVLGVQAPMMSGKRYPSILQVSV